MEFLTKTLKKKMKINKKKNKNNRNNNNEDNVKNNNNKRNNNVKNNNMNNKTNIGLEASVFSQASDSGFYHPYMHIFYYYSYFFIHY